MNYAYVENQKKLDEAFFSLDKYLKKKTALYNSRVDRLKEKLQDSKGLIEKRINTNKLKEFQSAKRDMQVASDICNICKTYSDKHNFELAGHDLSEIADELGKFDKETAREVHKLISEDLRKESQKQNQHFEKKINECLKQLKSLGFNKAHIDMYQYKEDNLGLGYRQFGSTSVENLMQSIVKLYEEKSILMWSNTGEKLESSFKNKEIMSAEEINSNARNMEIRIDSIENNCLAIESLKKILNEIYNIDFSKTLNGLDKIVEEQRKEKIKLINEIGKIDYEKNKKETNGKEENVIIEDAKNEKGEFDKEKTEILNQDSAEDVNHSKMVQNEVLENPVVNNQESKVITIEDEVNDMTNDYLTEKDKNPDIRLNLHYPDYMREKVKGYKGSYLEYMKGKYPSQVQVIKVLELREKRDKTIYEQFMIAKANGYDKKFEDFAKEKFSIDGRDDFVDSALSEDYVEDLRKGSAR
ncbi:MAG: hypothetical protein ACI31R_03395 [Bacilli bacterium]